MHKIDIRNSFCFDGYASGAGVDFNKIINASNFSNATGNKTDDFINKYKNYVIQATKGTGLFPSVKMAQMIIESSWGQGITATQANNFFGIKADASWNGEKKAFNTPKDGKPVNYFRVYPTALDSIKDHTNFLKNNSRYPKAGVFNASTPEEQITKIAKAGYAEAGKYDKAVIALINAYGLKSLDREAGLESKDDYSYEDSPLNSTVPNTTGYVHKINKKKKVISMAVMAVGITGMVTTTIMLFTSKGNSAA